VSSAAHWSGLIFCPTKSPREAHSMLVWQDVSNPAVRSRMSACLIKAEENSALQLFLPEQSWKLSDSEVAALDALPDVETP
jgi:hypothetical protein